MKGSGVANVIRNLKRWEAMKMAGLDGLGRLTAAEAAAKSKAEHPWKNQSHHAEQGLYGKWRAEDKVIEHGHRVDYGVHLELGFNGRYAILEPTINAIKNTWYENVKRIMEH